MTPEERSKRLRKEADQVLDMVCLQKHCAHIGQFIPTGSYFLDLMMYPDIDLYIPPTTPKILINVGIKLVEYECVKEIIFQKGSSCKQPELAQGFYLKPLIEYGNWGRYWKIDIWSLPKDVVDRKQEELRDIKDRMTPTHRKTILNYKFNVLTETGRTPMFSGFFIYQAVINHGLQDFDQITTYLRDNGIKM